MQAHRAAMFLRDARGRLVAVNRFDGGTCAAPFGLSSCSAVPGAQSGSSHSGSVCAEWNGASSVALGNWRNCLGSCTPAGAAHLSGPFETEPGAVATANSSRMNGRIHLARR